MTIVVTYDFYVDEYGGTLSEDAFKASLNSSEAFVRYLIGENLVDTDKKLQAARCAICSVVEVFSTYGVVEVGGFSIGGFSMSASGDGLDPKEMARTAAWQYLAPLGLLFSGVR